MSNGAESKTHFANVTPPRRGQGTAVATDATVRPYDLTALSWNGQKWRGNVDESLFLDIQNDGTFEIYFYFSDVSATDLSESVPAAGTALALSLTVPAGLPAGQTVGYEIERDI